MAPWLEEEQREDEWEAGSGGGGREWEGPLETRRASQSSTQLEMATLLQQALALME